MSGTKVKVEIKSIQTMLKRLGLDRDGGVQIQLTNIVNRRLTRYMPAKTGMLSTKLKFVKSPTEIEILGPYARYQYHGKVMVNTKTGKGPMNIPGVGPRYKKGTVLKATDRDLQYDHTKNALAGPHWDRRMMTNEGDEIVAELQEYVDGGTP